MSDKTGNKNDKTDNKAVDKSKIQKKSLIGGLREFLTDSTLAEWTLGWVAGEVVSRFLMSLVHDLIFPILSALLLDGFSLDDALSELNGVTIHWGSMLSTAIDMIIVLFVVFLICEYIYHVRLKHNLEQAEYDEQLFEQSLNNTALLTEIRDLLAQNATEQNTVAQNATAQNVSRKSEPNISS